MGIHVIVSAAVLTTLFVGVVPHPERPPILDPTQARELFRAAETNRTPDGFLTEDEINQIFAVFDEDGDGGVSKAEFRDTWLTRELGDGVSADYLFSRADTDQDGVITEFPDMQRVFHYFDTNDDNKVDEVEFIIIWNSLSN